MKDYAKKKKKEVKIVPVQAMKTRGIRNVRVHPHFISAVYVRVLQLGHFTNGKMLAVFTY